MKRRKLERISDHLSAQEAADMLGVSLSSIYGYVRNGLLPSTRFGRCIGILPEDVHCLNSKPPGRVRTITPPWRIPPAQNSQLLTTITVRLHQNQGTAIAGRLAEMRREHRHIFPGTASRYIVLNQCDPDEVEILLFWRGAIMPSDEERHTALAILAADFVDVLDWETASLKECQVLLHAQ